jgi:hypothetical protein
MAASFAGHAAAAMELARARIDQIILAQAEDHDRITGDLHDHVIQELFALGMTLQGHAARSDPADAERDQGLYRYPRRGYRQYPHQHFRAPPVPGGPAGLHTRLLAIVEEHAPRARLRRRYPFRRPARPGPGRSPGPRHYRQRPRRRHPGPLQWPDQYAQPHRKQRRYLPGHHPRQRRRHPPDLDRPPSAPPSLAVSQSMPSRRAPMFGREACIRPRWFMSRGRRYGATVPGMSRVPHSSDSFLSRLGST